MALHSEFSGLYAPGAGVQLASSLKRLVPDAKAAERTAHPLEPLLMGCSASCAPGPGRCIAACAARSDGRSILGLVDAKDEVACTVRNAPPLADAGE